MKQFIHDNIIEDRKISRQVHNDKSSESVKRNIINQLKSKVNNLEKQLTHLKEYEDKLKEELNDIKYQGGDKRLEDKETIQRLRNQLEKANLILANLIQLDRMSDSEVDDE